MTKITYFLSELDIIKMPGFPRGLEKLKMAKNITVITGPNASGKSSTARIMKQLIWPEKKAGFDANAQVKVNEDNWSIKMDSHTVQVQCNGINSNMSGIPAAEGSHRYLLPLHELIKDDEKDLAKEILRQTMGGYDLGAAGSILNYSSSIKNINNTPYRKIEEVDKKLKATKIEHLALKNKEDKLIKLAHEKEEILLASKLKDLYHLKLNLVKEEQKFKDFIIQKELFSSTMDQLNGEENQNIEELELKISQTSSNILIATEKIKEAHEEIDTVPTAANRFEEKDVTTITARIEKLKNLNRSIDNLTTKILAQEERTLSAANAIDPLMDVKKWQGLDLGDVGDLDKFFLEANGVIGENKLLGIEKTRIDQELQGSELQVQRDAEKIGEGIKTLSSWLKEQNSDHGVSNGLLFATALAGIITAVFSFYTAWGLIGLFPIVVLVVYSLRQPHQEATKIREKDFAKLGLTPPVSWNPEKVTELLEHLFIELRLEMQKKNLQQKIKECSDKIIGLSPRLEQLDSESKKWKDKLGTIPEISSTKYGELAWFLKYAKDWQESFSVLQTLRKEKKSEEELFQLELDKVNAFFIDFGLREIRDEIEAAAIFKELADHSKFYKEQLAIIEREQKSIKIIEKEKNDIANKLEAIYLKLKVENNDKASVGRLISNLNAYREVCNNIAAIEINLVEKTGELKAHSFFSKQEDNLRDLSLDKVKEKIDALTEKAEKLEELSKEITYINTLIDSKKKGSELEDILSERENTLNEVEKLYETNLSSRTGNLILDQLKKETNSKNNSEIFKRANELLNLITHGRYKMEIIGQNDPVFRAIDNVLNQGLDLSEISTGTRVQFLLAIRLAFLESIETTMKLPIFADELLANSDDVRATAIIEALIEISKNGRQVFYFTAQDDEVRKWDQHLEKHPDLDFKIISLTGREISKNTEFPPKKISFTQSSPEASGKTHSQFGAALNVPPFDLLIQEINELHLWYLLEDNDLLSACLKLRIECWGQFENYRKHKIISEKLDESLWEELKIKTKLLQQVQTLYRQGRSRPINRDILETSGALTPRYLDDVSEKLKKLNGDAKALLTALKNKEIKIYKHEENTNKLEEFLLNENYIDELEPLDEENFTQLISEYVSHLDISLEDAQTFCNRIFEGDIVSYTTLEY